MKDHIISFTETLKSNQKIFSFDEASTKQAIVLRILYFLGWDTFNVEEVTPEYSVKSKRVDYSLRLNDANKAFVEVKKTSEELDNHQEQLLNYSFQEGVKLSILTNGVTWWFYLPLNEGGWEERRFYSIDLIQQEPEDIAQKFIDFLSKENIYNGKAIKNAEAVYKSQQKKNVIKDTLPKAWNKIISEPDELFVELLNETTEKICGYRPETELIENFLAKNRDNWLTSDMSPPKKKKFPPEKPSKFPERQKKKPILNSESPLVFRIKAVRGADATAEINQKGLVIKKGSEIATSDTRTIPENTVKERQELIDKGVIVKKGDKLVFSQDYLFTRPTPAAQIVMGRSANGRTAWEDKEGRTLKSCQLQDM